MNKTQIEWCDYSINPVKGLCPMACPYCYARRIYKHYHWDETIRWSGDTWLDFYCALSGRYKQPSRNIKEGARIFVGSTMELFGPWVKPEWMTAIMQCAQEFPKHTFIFLTKQPQNLANWSPFPKNCWVGFSATDAEDLERRVIQFQGVEAAVRFISFEPLLGRVWRTEHWQESLGYVLKAEHFNWLIIGQQTPFSKRTAPKVEWVREIAEAADAAKIPVFLKNKLESMQWGAEEPTWAFRDRHFKTEVDGQVIDCVRAELRQEFPKAK